jgi:hypothetical protein
LKLRLCKLLIAPMLAILLCPSVGCLALDVMVNQTGYERYAPKVFRAQRATDYAGNGTFTVRTSAGADVCTGTLVRKGGVWNKYYWEGDFSSLTVDGDYYISATVSGETGTSYTFNVSVGSLLARTGKPTYQYFTAQRCGTAVSLQYVNRAGNTVTWSHNSCHTDDGYIYPSGPRLDTAGGWHDSGEYQKYGQFFGGHAVYDLLTLYDSNRSYFDSLDTDSNGIADILDECIWQSRWLAKMVQSNGHVAKQISKRRSGASWVTPEADTDRVIGTSDDRWVELGDCVTPTEIIVCSSLIKMHRVAASKGLNTENFASKAQAIWDHRVALAIQEGGHNNLGDAAHHIWAGIDLYAVYGSADMWNRACQKVDEVAAGAINDPASYDTAVEGAGYDLAALAWFARTYPGEPQATTAATAVQALMSHHMSMADDPVGLIRRLESGQTVYFPANPSLGINRLYGTIALGAIEAYRLLGDASYLRFALDQYNWILGSNYFRTCMMEAVGDSYVNKYHTRYDTFITNGIEPGVVINGYIRDGSGLPWLDFGTGSVSAQANESWLPNSAAYAAALAGMSVFAGSNQTPYSTVISLPGTIQAENYDVGGESIAYRDTSPGNSGGAYRSDNVDIEACSEGGYDVGWIDTGEWLDYSVNVTTGGTYDLMLRAATPSAGCSFHILMNGRNVCGATSIPNTGGWQTWTTVTVPSVALSAGQQVLTIYVDSGSWNVNYLQVNAVQTDTTAPTFGGSISPSVTNSLAPTITITAQDTGVGLNVGSAEFAYSVDGGTSFGTYMGRYVLHSSGAGGGGGNMYWYPDFYHPTYTIASGDHLQYDIYSNNSDGTGAVDIEGSFGNLRDSGILDQNGLSGHSNTNLYSRDYHQWYHRDFDLSSKAGQTISAYEMAHETDSGVSDFYVRNVIITNNGLVKDRAANSDAWSPVTDTVAPGNNNYSSTVGPEMIAGDPASPAACTGGSGTTAMQNVTAAFSTRMMPLLAGGNNRIKYHISDMNGNRAVSSTFAINVDQTAPTCTIGTPSPTAVNTGGSFSYPVTYADSGSGIASVNLTTSKVHVSTQSGTASATVSSISNGATATPTVNLTNATGTGTLRIYIDGGVATDAAGNTDAGATAGTNVTVTAPGPVTVSNSTFDSDTNGWTIVLWHAGPYSDGAMAWNSGAGNGGGGMRCSGSGASDNSDTCTREGGEIRKTISTSGYSNIKVSYDLRVNTLGGNYTGAGAGSCSDDHSLIDEQVTVYYSTDGGSSWTEAEYLARGSLLAGYQSYGTRTIDLTGVTACNNNANFALRFRWQCNSSADLCDLDNIKVTSN